jgi:hypothetical protein
MQRALTNRRDKESRITKAGGAEAWNHNVKARRKVRYKHLINLPPTPSQTQTKKAKDGPHAGDTPAQGTGDDAPDNAYADGSEDGHNDGHNDGQDDAQDDGRDDAQDDGQDDGCDKVSNS